MKQKFKNLLHTEHPQHEILAGNGRNRIFKVGDKHARKLSKN